MQCNCSRVQECNCIMGLGRLHPRLQCCGPPWVTAAQVNICRKYFQNWKDKRYLKQQTKWTFAVLEIYPAKIHFVCCFKALFSLLRIPFVFSVLEIYQTKWTFAKYITKTKKTKGIWSNKQCIAMLIFARYVYKPEKTKAGKASDKMEKLCKRHLLSCNAQKIFQLHFSLEHLSFACL